LRRLANITTRRNNYKDETQVVDACAALQYYPPMLNGPAQSRKKRFSTSDARAGAIFDLRQVIHAGAPLEHSPMLVRRQLDAVEQATRVRSNE
jgi:hypothetical protein